MANVGNVVIIKYSLFYEVSLSTAQQILIVQSNMLIQFVLYGSITRSLYAKMLTDPIFNFRLH
jgi:hypothetical protein